MSSCGFGYRSRHRKEHGSFPNHKKKSSRERQETTMCGFVGFINGGDTQQDAGVLRSMTNAIRHRDPDDAD